ncbi:acetyl-CoA carboxylase subunit alpha [Marinobacter algicola DG893]|uniref:Acetyl-CoA carboxylase subunit alpha n=1 Tax=Marinobacter algicola DG893 TaxID=443152 RepID=A6F3D3_9GAMM|nr:acetyl-CoA carboxylase subunit alpha [Marinobacter algicola DG893]
MIYVYGGYLAAVGIQIRRNMEKQNRIHATAEGNAKV